VLHSDGKSIVSQEPISSSVESEETEVCLVEGIKLPAQKGRVLQTKMSSPLSDITDLLLEPDHDLFKQLGVSAMEYVVNEENGNVNIPIQNFQGVTVHLEAGI